MVKCYLKIHSQSGKVVVGACDEDCLGRILKNPPRRFHVSEPFFKDKLVEIEEAIQVLKQINNFNIVGKHLIEASIKSSLVHPEGVLEMEGVPIALKFLF